MIIASAYNETSIWNTINWTEIILLEYHFLSDTVRLRVHVIFMLSEHRKRL